MGYTDSINYGMITSITEREDVDGEYKVIATDMAASDTSYGFLLNLDGNMVGIVAQKFKQTGAADTLVALGILTSVICWNIGGGQVAFLYRCDRKERQCGCGGAFQCSIRHLCQESGRGFTGYVCRDTGS